MRLAARLAVRWRRGIRLCAGLSSAWGPPPAAPVGLAERILAAAQDPAPPVSRRRGGASRTQRFWRAGLPLATVAASVVAAITVGLLIPRLRLDQPRPNDLAPRSPLSPRGVQSAGADPVSADPRALNEAVAGATAATWDLARSASEPAARISRQVLDAATEPETGSGLARSSARSRSRSPLGVRSHPTPPPPWRRCSRSATALPRASVPCRRRPVTHSASCSDQHSPSPRSAPARQPRREPDGTEIRHFRT